MSCDFSPQPEERSADILGRSIFKPRRILSFFASEPRSRNAISTCRRISNRSLHYLDSSVSSNKVQTLPLLDTIIALAARGNSQHTTDVPGSACAQLAYAKHTSRAVRLLHCEGCRFTLDRRRCRVGVWLRRGEEWTVRWCGEEGAVDGRVGAQSEDQGREGGGC